VIRREAARLVKFFEGIHAMEKLPGDVRGGYQREHNAVAEARRLKIPVVAIVDTNCDPDLVDYLSRATTTPPLGEADPGHHRQVVTQAQANTKPSMPAARPPKLAPPP